MPLFIPVKAQTIFVLGGEEKANFVTGTLYYYGCHLSRASRPPYDGSNQINLGLKVVGNWTIKDVLIHQSHSTQYTGSLTYSIVTLSTSTNLITSIINAGSTGGSVYNYGIAGVTPNVDISDGQVLALCMTANASVGQTLPSNTGVTSVTAHLYCIPR
jgi:hypothetical protein